MIQLKEINNHPNSMDGLFYEDMACVNSKNLNLSSDRENDYREKYIELVEALFPIIDNTDILHRIVMISNSLFEAERGALFWFKNGKFTKTPQLKASVNLTQKQISNNTFKSNLNLVLDAFHKNHFVVDRYELDIKRISKKKPFCSALSLPLKIKGKVRAVLYHDKFRSNNGFDFFIGDNNLADQLIRHITAYVEYGLEYRIPSTKGNKKSLIKLKQQTSEKETIIYKSSVMENLIQEADKAARSDTSVLIVGETGVGKELLARRIHKNSNRRSNPFVTINATTITEGLFESELFGHEKGAFTGADRQKKGLIEVADGGTLFIDEIGEMPLHMQVKLLRAIQEKTFYRVGGTKTIHSDFRLVTATNSDLLLEACEGRFREDLYYRLNLFSFTIPPLRERGEDMILIAKEYLSRYAEKYCKEAFCLNSKTKRTLMSYAWPGNVRELKNVIEKSVIVSSPDEPFEVNLPVNNTNIDLRNPFSDEPTLDEINRRYIQHVLKKTNGKISGPGGATEVLDIRRTTLTARMRKLGIH